MEYRANIWTAIKEIRETLGLSNEECQWSSGIIAIEPQDDMEKITIEENISNILCRYSNVGIGFRKCIFRQPIILRQIIFENVICCIDSVFEQMVEFIEVDFINEVDFSGTKFVKGIDFFSSNLKKSLFSKTIFADNAYFNEVKFLNFVSFSGTHFEGEASFTASIFKQDVYFNHVIFDCKTNFHNAIFYDEVSFSDTTFKMEVFFSGTLFNNNVHFDKVTFDNQVYFDDVKFGDNLEFHKGKSNYITNFSDTNFKNGADFFNATFTKRADFFNAVFGGYTSFEETIFLEVANFLRVHFEGRACFTSSSFKQNAYFTSVTFHGDASFDHVKFQVGEDYESDSITDFSGAHFQERAFFTKTHFYKMANFFNVIFDHNAYFNGAYFRQKADFSQSEFCKNTYFYKTKFKEIPKKNIQEKDIPNFLQTIFNGSINLTDTPLFMFNFKDLKSIIRDSHKANEFRDIFKNIKNALIKDNNLLDASRFHKMELYAKELELEYKKKEEAQNLGIRDVIDRIQLMFYRLTSDHHTDLLLILNNVIFLIAWFGIMNGALNFLFNQDYFDLSIEKIIMTLGAFVACFIFVAVIFCFMFGYFKIFFVTYAKKRFYCKVRKMWKQFNLRQLYNKYKNKNGIFCVAYITTAIILVVKPALLVPIFGQMIDSKSAIGFAFASLNIIYAILMFLLIFSLQKTARKNTIVPN